MSKGHNIYKGTFTYADVFKWLDQTTEQYRDDFLVSLGMGDKTISDLYDEIELCNMTQEDRFLNAIDKFNKRGVA